MPEWAIAAFLEAPSVACAIHLWWRARGSAVHKLSWTPVVLVPVVGPLFYGGLYSGDPVQSEDLRAVELDIDEEALDVTSFRSDGE